MDNGTLCRVVAIDLVHDKTPQLVITYVGEVDDQRL